MFSSLRSVSPRPGRRAALAALLVILCFLLAAPVLWAAEPTEAAVGAAPPLGMVVGFVNDILGNRTRMIQVGLVFVAIGVFLLTRAIPH